MTMTEAQGWVIIFLISMILGYVIVRDILNGIKRDN